MCLEHLIRAIKARNDRNAAARLAPPKLVVEKPQYVICCVTVGGAMRSTKHSIRAGRRTGRF